MFNPLSFLKNDHPVTGQREATVNLVSSKTSRIKHSVQNSLNRTFPPGRSKQPFGLTRIKILPLLRIKPFVPNAVFCMINYFNLQIKILSSMMQLQLAAIVFAHIYQHMD
jgi:hypothetical protein